MSSGDVLDMLYLILGILAVLLLLSLPWLNWFLREMRFLNMEIQRSHGKEQERWKRRKRRLWLSIIPFVKYR